MTFNLKIISSQKPPIYIAQNRDIEGYGKVSIILVGDFLGVLNKDGCIESEGTNKIENFIMRFLRQTEIKDFSLNSCVGSFTLIFALHDHSKLLISTSTSGVTPYIIRSAKGLINVSFDENFILKNYKSSLSKIAKYSASISHQLVTRSPLTLFDVENVRRCPSGHNTIVNIKNNTYTFHPYLNKEEFIFSPRILQEALKSILILYKKYYRNDIGLAFSGGLDSSCLAAILKKIKVSIPFYHVDYKGEKSKRSRVAHYISDYLGFSTLHLARHDSRINLTDMIDNCKAGFVTVPNTMYLGSPINKYIKDRLPSNLITGQGADSIYVIDSFAPPTELINDARVNEIVKSKNLRLSLTNNNICSLLGIDNRKILQSQIHVNQNFRNLLNNQCVSVSEHVDYSNLEELKSNSLNAYRLSTIADKVFNILIPEFFVSNPQSSILSMYRYIKWMRSLVNVPVQYASAQLAQGVNRLTPFLEGPVVNMFFGFDITSLESINIKAQLEHLFIANADVSHRTLVEKSLSSIPHTSSAFGRKLSQEMDSSQYNILANQALSSLYKESQDSVFMNDIINNVNSADQLLRLASLIED